MCGCAPVLKNICARESMAFFNGTIFCFRAWRRYRAGKFSLSYCQVSKRHKALYVCHARAYLLRPAAPMTNRPGSLFRTAMVLEQERGLRQGKQKYQSHDAPDLETHPGRSRGVAPHRLVQRGQRQEENPPAQCETAPTFFRQLECFGKNIFDEEPIEAKPGQKRDTEDSVEDGELHFDENFVVQIEREPSEDHDKDRGDERNGRQFFLAMPADRQ